MRGALQELNGILEKQPGPEVLEQLEQYQEGGGARCSGGKRSRPGKRGMQKLKVGAACG